jgi:hypothetical protein
MSDLQNLFTQTMDRLKTSVQSSSKYPIVEVKSTVDNRVYKVRDMSDKQAAADLLARVRIKINKLYLHLLLISYVP